MVHIQARFPSTATDKTDNRLWLGMYVTQQPDVVVTGIYNTFFGKR